VEIPFHRRLVLWSVALAAGTSHAEPAAPLNCQRLCHEIDTCAATADHAPLSDLLCDVARCETGDRCLPGVRSPSSLYRGPFQFSARSWRSLCRPVFHRRHLSRCDRKGAIYDTCCATICAADLIADDTNGGLKNWPTCGPRARETASKRAAAAPTSPPAE
jgi:hypothetical protein